MNIIFIPTQPLTTDKWPTFKIHEIFQNHHLIYGILTIEKIKEPKAENEMATKTAVFFHPAPNLKINLKNFAEILEAVNTFIVPESHS